MRPTRADAYLAVDRMIDRFKDVPDDQKAAIRMVTESVEEFMEMAKEVACAEICAEERVANGRMN